MFSWDHPLGLLALILLVPCGLLLLRDRATLRDRQTRFADLPLFRRMNIRLPQASEFARLSLKLLALLLLFVSLAGPRIGGKLGTRLPGELPSLVVALDVSKSMGATDTAPSRLDVARAQLITMTLNLAGWRASLLAFADDAVVFCPMTTDLGAIEALLNRMKPDMREVKPGSNLEAAVHAAIQQLQGRPGAILLATDGESLSGDPAKAATEAAKAGIPLYVIGVGTLEGAPFPDGTDLFGTPLLKTGGDGAPILSHANPQGLSDLAKTTGGSLVDGATSGAAEHLLVQLKKRTGADAVTEQGESLYQWPLALGLLLLILEDMLHHRGQAQFPHLSLAGFARRAGRLSGLFLIVMSLSQIAWTWPWEQGMEIRRAAAAYAKGDWKQALSHMESAQVHDPDNPHLRYDLGNAQYQAGNFEAAVRSFSSSLEHLNTGTKSREWGHYNLGNSLYRLGEAKGDRKSRWSDAIKHFEETLKLNPKDEDARFNLELVKKRLQELPPEPNASHPSSKNGEPSPDPADQAQPHDAEVQATLDALQHQELQHQAELDARHAPPPPTTGDLLKHLMNQGPRGTPASDRPDW